MKYIDIKGYKSFPKKNTNPIRKLKVDIKSFPKKSANPIRKLEVDVKSFPKKNVVFRIWRR